MTTAPLEDVGVLAAQSAGELVEGVMPADILANRDETLPRPVKARGVGRAGLAIEPLLRCKRGKRLIYVARVREIAVAANRNKTIELLLVFAKETDVAYRDNPNGVASGTWTWIAVILVGVVFVAIAWAYSVGPSEHAGNSANSNRLTGQATSSSGSTTVGAPPGTKPKETSGQASTPAGTTTTGAKTK